MFYPKKSKLIIFIFLLFLNIVIPKLTAFGQDSDTYFELKELIESKAPWPKANIKDGYIASDDPWRTYPNNRYYVWSDDKERAAIQVFNAGGEIENEYGTLSLIETGSFKMTKKDIKSTLDNGDTIYFDRLTESAQGSSSTNTLFSNKIQLEFYDRIDGESTYEDWVIKNFFNRELIIDGDVVVSFSGTDDALVKDKLRQGANGQGEWAEYVGKNADPDQDGFWAPYGGSLIEDNSASGSGEGSSSLDLALSSNSSCYPNNLSQVECGNCTPPWDGVADEQELYEKIQSSMFGFGTLTKCYYSQNGCGGPTDPTGSLTDLIFERWYFSGLGNVGDPEKSGTIESPSSTWASSVTPYDNGRTITFKDDFCHTFPLLRNDLIILGPVCSSGETGIITHRIIVEGANGILYDSNRTHPDLFPMECVPGTVTDGWEYNVPISNESYFDFTSGSTTVIVENPYAYVGDLGKLDLKGRWGSFLGGYKSEGGPIETPYNYSSRCGEQNSYTGKINPVLCQHSFPHTIDSGENGNLAKEKYITGNYLDINNDGVADDIINGDVAFTNYEEFVWDTDPLTANSSNNNVLTNNDEMHIAGVGHSELEVSDLYKKSLELGSSNVILNVEGTSQVPMETTDSSYWIANVNSNDNVYQDYSLGVEILAYNTSNGEWKFPTVGQKSVFKASVGEKEDSNVQETSEYSWYLYYREKNSNEEYNVIDLKENIVGLHTYDKFEINKEGSYRVEVIVSDVYGHSGKDYFDFDVNGDFILEYPLAIKGDPMTVRANIEGLNLDLNSPIVWKLDNKVISTVEDAVFEFLVTKEAGNSHEIELSGISLTGDASRDSITTKINIPVVKPTVTIQVPNMEAGYLDRGFYEEGKEITAQAIPGPTGSSWADSENIFRYTWACRGMKTCNNNPSDEIMAGPANSKIATIGVNVFRETENGYLQRAEGLIYLKSLDEKEVKGAFTEIYSKIKYGLYFIFILFAIMILYLSIHKRNHLKRQKNFITNSTRKQKIK